MAALNNKVQKIAHHNKKDIIGYLLKRKVKTWEYILKIRLEEYFIMAI